MQSSNVFQLSARLQLAGTIQVAIPSTGQGRRERLVEARDDSSCDLGQYRAVHWYLDGTLCW